MTGRFGRFLRQNTIALLALFIALGGTTFAASTIVLPANSVGAKQLKKNAVINKKIKANAVTGSKVKNDSLKGADILESSLGKVPSAASADDAALLGGNAASVFAPKAQEAVHLVGTSGQPPFANAWHNFGGSFSFVGFWKDSFGVVHLQGTFTGGSGPGTTAFTLPVGYRPTQDMFVPVATGTAGSAFMYVRSTGEVQPQNDPNDDDGIDGLSFRAAGSSAAASGHAGRPEGRPGH
jgi:hypothetical protein